jgi:nickel-dependent lactate racemase
MGPSYICEDAVIEEGKELNDVVCAAYRMGCDQTREVYQKRIERLEAALDDVAGYLARADWYYLKPETRKALEGKDGA